VRQFLLKNNFLVIVIAVSILSLSSCEKKYDLVIDSTVSAPFLTHAQLSTSVVKTDSLPVGQIHKYDDLLSIRDTVQVFCASGINEIGSVRYTLTGDQFSSNLSEGFLKDDGISPDIIKGDSVFTGYVDFQINRVVVGNLFLKLWSESTDGSFSNVITLPLQISRYNNKPEISDLILPDTVNSNQTSPIEIKVKVIDPDGQDDIRFVYRVTQSNKLYKLSGSQGDSIFTETFSSIPPAGTYRFRFFALDQSYDSSSVLVDSIVIK
jgi:hypothetical protein